MITAKKYTFNNTEYKIMRYDKKTMKNLEEELIEHQDYHLFRSVILRDKKIVCFSPPKSMDYERFVAQNPDPIASKCRLEDFIDGTMINVFYDIVNSVWEIATRSTVGGNIIFFNDVKNYKYYDSNNYFNNYYDLTFRTMFFEACNTNNLNLETLDRRYMYSFVMQHPFNRIVAPVHTSAIYLVKVYEIANNVGNAGDTIQATITEIDLDVLKSYEPFIFLNTTVKFVNRYPLQNYKENSEYYASPNLPYYCVGCMIYNEAGDRSKIRNKNYEMVRQLRGNHPKLQYNYLCLKKENKIKEFLTYYPEHTIMFKKFRLLIYNYTNDLFANYIDCFINKKKPLKDYDFQFKNQMYKLHELFKTNLRPIKKFIDKKFVIDYVNDLHPAQQMFLCSVSRYDKGGKKGGKEEGKEEQKEDKEGKKEEEEEEGKEEEDKELLDYMDNDDN